MWDCKTWDLLLIDVTGLWARDEFPTAEPPKRPVAPCASPFIDGWDDARLVRRMNARDHWNTPDGQRRAL